MDILLQVDTSNEETKSGVSGEALLKLACFVNSECDNLNLKGLMTIGAPGDFTCFDKLVEERTNVAQSLGIEANSLVSVF